MTDNVISIKRPPLALPNYARAGENSLRLDFNRELTKEELQFFWETCQRTVFLMRGLDLK